MTGTFFALALSLAAAAEPGPTQATPRPRNPFAPSLPQLTRQEEDQIDRVIDRFILFDTKQLTGLEGMKARDEFVQLGPEAIPALIRGLNRAARIEHSCPVVVIAKKLTGFLVRTDDRELLEFARDEIGAGVERTRHLTVLRDLRFACMLRQNALARQPSPGPGPATGSTRISSTTPSPQPSRVKSTGDLLEAASTLRGAQLRPVLTELARRKEPEALAGLALAARSSEADVRQLARELLDANLAALPAAALREKLRADDPEVRRSAARAAVRFPDLAGPVIDLLADDEPEVRAAAQATLVKLARGEDLGPPADATREQIATAQARWRAWAAK